MPVAKTKVSVGAKAWRENYCTFAADVLEIDLNTLKGKFPAAVGTKGVAGSCAQEVSGKYVAARDTW